MPKGAPCRAGHYFPGESCDMVSIARGLCRLHYDQARRLNLLEMKGEGGRPVGPKLATPLRQAWEDAPEPSWAELEAAAKKLMMAIMTDPGAAQQERNLVIKLAVTHEDAEADDAAKKRFQEMLDKARGLKAVGDE